MLSYLIFILASIFKNSSIVVSYKNVVKRLLEEEIITASNAKYTNIYINKNKLHEIAFTEEPYNYEKMLYKLIAQGLIQSDSKYI